MIKVNEKKRLAVNRKFQKKKNNRLKIYLRNEHWSTYNLGDQFFKYS